MTALEIKAARRLRTKVRIKMMTWVGEEHYSNSLAFQFAEILQFKGEGESPMAIIKWDEHHVELYEKLKLLDGPHGYAIFKAMQAKQKDGSDA